MERNYGKENIIVLYCFTATSRLWFDGSLWLIYWQHKGISLFDVGLLEAILHIVCLLVDVPIGVLADKLGWKLALMGSGMFGVLYCGLSLFGTNFFWAALAFAFRGVQITLTNGSDAALLFESAKWAGLTDKYQSISGKMMAIMLVSMAIAEATGGAIAGWSWDAVYIAFAVANLLSVIVTAGLKEPREEVREHEVSSRDSAWKIAKDAVRFAQASPLFRRWLLFSAMLSGFLATFSFYGQSLLLNGGWSLLGIGVLSGLENGFGAVMAVASERVTRRLGKERTTVLTGLLGGVGLILFAFVPGMGAGAGYLTGSAAGNFADPLIDKELNELIPSQQRATLLSANSTAFSLFMVLVFPVLGFAATHVGLVRAAEIGSVVGFVCIASAAFAIKVANRQFGRRNFSETRRPS